jgi:hypothetical protein
MAAGSGGGDAAAGVGAGSGGTGGAAAGVSGDAAIDAPVDGGAAVDGDAAIEPGDAAGDTRSTDVATDAIDARDVGEAGEDAAPKLVTVAFTGKVETVAPAPDGGMPLGFDTTVRLSSVSGSFTYDLGLADQEPSDPLRGKYQSAGAAAFSFTLKGHTVTGSGKALLETENLDPDTFRFLDGPQGDAVVRVMKLDGVNAPTLKLGIAITDTSGAMLTSDALPDPFPMVDIADTSSYAISHTFSLSDSGGTLLMQLDTLVNQ